ncbi:MAG: hypothetical protein V4594_09730 [Bacteroidota bacterium]
MKTTQITIWIVLLLAVFPAVLRAQSKDRDQFNIALSNPGKPFKLNMNLGGGSVNINTYEGSELHVTAFPQANTNANSGQGKNQNVNININTNVNVNVNSGAAGGNTNRNRLLKVSQNGNEIVIAQLNKNRALNVEVSLPENVASQLEITCADGPVVLKNISGSAIVTTVNGNVTATFKNVDAKAPMAFSTLIGAIDLSFPATVKAKLTLKSEEGLLLSDFALTGAVKSKLNRNKNGQYQSKLAGGLSAQLNGGGQEITITNMQGNIYLRKHK